MSQVRISLLTLFLVTACGENGVMMSSKKTISLYLDVSNSKSEAFGLSGKEPAFIGLGIEPKGKAKSSLQLVPGENKIELDQVDTDFKAALIMYRPDDTSKLYYSQAETLVNVSKSDTIELQFSPLKELPKTNVYGLAYVNDTQPAAGMAFGVVEPFSGAVVTLPGQAQLGTTDSRGVFSFNYFYSDPSSSKRDLQLKFFDGNKERVVTKTLGESNNGWSAVPFINLEGGQTTSPFSIDMSLLKGEPGPAGPQGPQGPSGVAGPQGPAGPSGTSSTAGSGSGVSLYSGDTKIGTLVASYTGIRNTYSQPEKFTSYFTKLADFQGQGPGYMNFMEGAAGPQSQTQAIVARPSYETIGYTGANCTGQSYFLPTENTESYAHPYYFYNDDLKKVFKTSTTGAATTLMSYLVSQWDSNLYAYRATCSSWYHRNVGFPSVSGTLSGFKLTRFENGTHSVFAAAAFSSNYPNTNMRMQFFACDSSWDCSDPNAWKITSAYVDVPAGTTEALSVFSTSKPYIGGGMLHALARYYYVNGDTFYRDYDLRCAIDLNVNSSTYLKCTPPTQLARVGTTDTTTQFQYVRGLVDDSGNAHYILSDYSTPHALYFKCTSAGCPTDAADIAGATPGGVYDAQPTRFGDDSLPFSTAGGYLLYPMQWYSTSDSQYYLALYNCKLTSDCSVWTNWSVAVSSSSPIPTASNPYFVLSDFPTSSNFKIAYLDMSGKYTEWNCAYGTTSPLCGGQVSASSSALASLQSLSAVRMAGGATGVVAVQTGACSSNDSCLTRRYATLSTAGTDPQFIENLQTISSGHWEINPYWFDTGVVEANGGLLMFSFDQYFPYFHGPRATSANSVTELGGSVQPPVWTNPIRFVNE